MKYVPNILSFIRLAMCPVFIWSFFNCAREIAFLIFALASILDVIDGYIARKFNCISNLGKIIDPVADKALQLSAVLCLTIQGILPLWVMLVLAGKELFTVLGGGLASKRMKRMVVSNPIGKLASFLITFSMCLLFFVDGVLSVAKNFVYITLYVSIVLTFLALISYVVIALRAIKEVEETPENKADEEKTEE